MSDATTTFDPDGVTLRNPSHSATLAELAPRKGEAIEIIETRVRILETLRKASIRTTVPEDWVLFKMRDEDGGMITGYLEDKGAQRVRDFWGIQIYNVSEPTKIVGTTPEDFHYRQTGDGLCKLTGQVVERVVGSRSSTEDFCRGKTGTELDVDVEKATRANLNGSITRELAGLGGVPIQELEAAWQGTGKTVERCAKGRGFGSGAERLGARPENEPTVPPPTCPHCKAKGQYRPARGKRKAFYGCPNWQAHRRDNLADWFVDVAEWIARSPVAPAAATDQARETTGARTPAPPKHEKVTPLDADEVFGSSKKPTDREPGQEG